jgi:nitrogen fixation/metabolism regulation signal transduction histidine kinase
MRFERQIVVWSLAGGLVAILMALVYVWTGGFSVQTKVTLTMLAVVPWLSCAFALREKTAFTMRTLSNLLGAVREKDYSLRLRGARRDDAMGEVIIEVNALARDLQNQRFSALEATALLRKVLAEIDVALFGFDREGRLRFVNDSGQRLLGHNERDLLGRPAESLGLQTFLAGPTPRLEEMSFPGGGHRWELRRATYRVKGQSHHLVFLSDMTRTLHEEERQAWRRLIQILRHEINNSLTPIQSVAQSLRTCLKQKPRSKGWESDLGEGLEIIAERSAVLGQFIASYSKLTRLPEPTPAQMEVDSWIRHVAGLETRVAVEVVPGPEVSIRADRSQLDQLLINLVSNAAEASREARPDGDGCVSVGWAVDGSLLEVWISDDGPGLDSTKDPFIPFFTTKPEGSGIGLALSRQIAEAHGGDLALVNHVDQPGCLAILRLPVGSSERGRR